MIGPSGVGKTHVSSALCYDAVTKGKQTVFLSLFDLTAKLTKARSTYSLIDYYARIPVLCLDEVGYVMPTRENAGYLFQIISKRGEVGTTIVTTNLVPSQWGKILLHHNRQRYPSIHCRKPRKGEICLVAIDEGVVIGRNEGVMIGADSCRDHREHLHIHQKGQKQFERRQEMTKKEATKRSERSQNLRVFRLQDSPWFYVESEEGKIYYKVCYNNETDYYCNCGRFHQRFQE